MDASPIADLFIESFNDSSSCVNGSLMSSFGYQVSTVYLCFITVAGVLLNGLVLLITAKDKQLHTPLNLILVNLATSDLCIAAFGGSLSINASMHHGWNMKFELCIAYAFAMSLAGIVSITTLSVLALWRCALVTWPLRKVQLGSKEALLLVLVIWIYSAAVTSPPLFGWGQYGYEASRISCSVQWEVQDWNSRSYILYLFAGGLFVPLSVMIVSYGCIMHVVQKSGRTVRSDSGSKGQRRITLMVAVMIVAFLIAWMPYAALSLAQTIGGHQMARFSSSTATIPSLFAKSSIVFNPLIYCGLNTQFHSSFKKVFGCTARTSHRTKEDAACTQHYVTRAFTTGFSVSANKKYNRGPNKLHLPSKDHGTLQPMDDEASVSKASRRVDNKDVVVFFEISENSSGVQFPSR